MRTFLLIALCLFIAACRGGPPCVYACSHEIAPTINDSQDVRTLSHTLYPSINHRIKWAIPSSLKPTWHALKDAAVLSPPTVDHSGRLYVTTGKGKGHSHLHVFDTEDGRLLWQSKPMENENDLDEGAVLYSPVIGKNNNVYIADNNQLFCYSPRGNLRWQTAAFPRAGVHQKLTNIILTDNLIGGVSLDGKIIFFDQRTGSIKFPFYQIPQSTVLPVSEPLPPGVWHNFISHKSIPSTWNFHHRLGAPQVRYPATIDPRKQWLYVTAPAEKPRQGIFYALVLDDEKGLSIAYSVLLKEGAGSRPVLSTDQARVYIHSGDELLAFNSDNGKVIWQIGAERVELFDEIDGTIYFYRKSPGAYVGALDGKKGNILWDKDYTELAYRYLKPVRYAQIEARMDGILGVSRQHVWVTLDFGYKLNLPNNPTLYKGASYIAQLDKISGAVHNMYPVPSNVAGAAFDIDGMFVALSATRHSIDRVRHDQLPSNIKKLEVNATANDTAGIVAFTPVSRKSLINQGLLSIAHDLDGVLEAIQEMDEHNIRLHVSNAYLQYYASRLLEVPYLTDTNNTAFINKLFEEAMGGHFGRMPIQQIEDLKRSILKTAHSH